MINQISKKNKQLHYGWIIVLTGTVVIFSCIGLGRFSLGMLLPSMSASLDLNYSQMGLLGTGNFVGYMISIIISGVIVRIIGARWTITMGLFLVGGAMLLISRASGFIQVLLLSMATGIGSGLANVPMMGLISHWFLKTTRGRATGVMLSGMFIPWVNVSLGSDGWRTAWLTIGCISILIALVAATLPNVFLFASIAIFGLAVWGIPTIMSAAVGDYMGPAKAVSAFGFITLFFGAGQISGPVAAGFLADVTGSFGSAFWMCAFLTIIGIVVCSLLKTPSHSRVM
jgi:MFS family permease